MICKTLDLLYNSICFYIFIVEQTTSCRPSLGETVVGESWVRGKVGGGGGARPEALSVRQVFHLDYFILST